MELKKGIARNMQNMGSVLSGMSRHSTTQAGSSFQANRAQSQMAMMAADSEQAYNTIVDMESSVFKNRKR